MSDTGSFSGKVALVTGAGSGIGRSCAVAFARAGADVIAADLDVEGNAETVRLVEQEGGRGVSLRCDVADPDDVERMVAATLEKFGRLDYACNNAGIGGTSAPTGEYPIDSWRRVIDVNLSGVFYCMRYEIPAMLQNGGGAIVNMSSILGQVGMANAPAYVAAKHGLNGLTKSTAVEYATRGIRVNAICPAFITTPLLEKAGIVEGTEMHSMLTSLHPMRRFGTPEEVAEAVVWLCSDGASFVTGEALLVDGGYVAV